MKYIIMCGGEYKEFKTPKQLLKVNGERIVDRTIRLLKENGVNEIYISSNNSLFDSCNVIRLENKKNNWKQNERGYWLDAFYPTNEPTKYIFGDVYFTNKAIKKIVDYKTDKEVLFGTEIAKNEFHENWGEPFCYYVNDTDRFKKAITEVKKMYDKGKIKRHPIVWELYRYLNGLDINIQNIKEDTYEVIDDGTMDVDSLEELEQINSGGD